MNLEEVDRQYNLRLCVPDMPVCVKGWTARSEAARARLPHRLNVPYGPTLDEYCDIFPSGRPRAPIHIFFHGGYWRVLSAREFSFLAPVGHDNDWTTIIVNYSLCPKVKLTEIVRQARAAVAWVYRQAEMLNGAPDRIFVSGHSAGGQLVGRLLATDWAGEYGLPADLIKGALPISGLFDLEPMRWSWLQPGLQLTCEEIASESPIRHLPTRSVPTVVAVGGEETEAFRAQSRDYAARLAAAGLPGDYEEVFGCHHFTVLDALAESDGTLWQALCSMADGRAHHG